MENIEITSARYDMNYRIALTFSDGKEKTVKLKELVESSKNKKIQELQDTNEFKKFRIEHGGLHWENNSLSLSPEFLYNAECDIYDITI